MITNLDFANLSITNASINDALGQFSAALAKRANKINGEMSIHARRFSRIAGGEEIQGADEYFEILSEDATGDPNFIVNLTT